MHYNHLTREQRYAIYQGLQEGKSHKAIARQIKVHHSTVGREIKHYSTRMGRYSWRIAQESASVRKECMPRNRGIDKNILKEILHFLKTEYRSPKQISGYLYMKSKQISHETIYKRIMADETRELRNHCRHKLKYRRHAKVVRKTKLGNIPNRTSIRERAEEADGSRFGDWGMDLIIGNGQKSAILTLCERSKNYLLMARLPHGKNPENVVDMVIMVLSPYRKNVQTIATDNGSEFAYNKKIAKALGTTVYFADSYASWQRGVIENENKLIRQYIPKGMDFREISDEFIKEVQYKINRRPREKQNFSAPKRSSSNLFRNIALTD